MSRDLGLRAAGRFGVSEDSEFLRPAFCFSERAFLWVKATAACADSCGISRHAAACSFLKQSLCRDGRDGQAETDCPASSGQLFLTQLPQFLIMTLTSL